MMSRLTSAGLLCGLLSVLCWTGFIRAHPQCLDFRPPFAAVDDVGFCSVYSTFGCCTVDRDEILRQRFNDIVSQFQQDKRYPLSMECQRYVKDLTCQQCSPYAAHLFDSEANQIERPIAGMCGSYCHTFYDRCRDAVRYLTGDANVIDSLSSRDAFCSNNALTDVDYCYPDLLYNQNLNAGISPPSVTAEGCLCLEEFASGLRNPLLFHTAPDDTGRIFVGEQVGMVHIYYKNKTRLSDPFLDLTHLVLTSSNSGDERGFLGLAFHPDFKNNKKFYVSFTLREANSGQQKSRISEFRVSAADENKIDASSERVILEVDQPYWNHNGGEVLFGVDGYLYVFLGDGGAGGDPHNNGQNKNVLLGKVLRLDINMDINDSQPYKIPLDNPFRNEQGVRPEIYAYGIRNIWRCDVDEGDPDTGYGRGRIICGDVGQSAFEEIDIITKGGNYGWNAREGFACYDNDKCGKIGPEVLPIFAYPHSEGKSVTGGHVYRGCLNPNLQGQYIYGDYVRGRLFRLTENRQTNEWTNTEILMCGTDVCFNGLVERYETNILSFGEDADGELYMLTTSHASTAAPEGKIYKFIDPRRRGDPNQCRTAPPRPTVPPTTSSTTTISTTTIATDPCDRVPCQNNGYCISAEDPYGWGFFCYCRGEIGGRLCQIVNPCSTVPCPRGTFRCRKTYGDDKDPCDRLPCQNNGYCISAEDPYGWGFFCYCRGEIGGRLCQIVNPCSTVPCPRRTFRCRRSYTDDKGRFCYDYNWNLLD